jgi:hypothetical protein
MTITLTPVPSNRPAERQWSREHIRAPRGDESFVAQPELSSAVELARRNRAGLAAAAIDVQGKNFALLRRWARHEVYRAARDYTGRLVPGGELPTLRLEQIEATTFFVGGHQPTLFHPGVWVKNFVVGHLARVDRAVGLNLVVDTDTLSGTSIRVPTGTVDAPSSTVVPFDEPRSRQPWEEARIVNRELFASFAERALATFGDRGFRPILGDFWPAAVRHSESTDSLAECLTAARCSWERSWNVNNLELPVSRLCTLEPFLWFASHILAHLPRFASIYNDVLREYRIVNRVRSRTHPVPDLREFDGWLEAPFRVWRAGDEVRRRVFARQEGGEIRLSDGNEVFASLPLAPDKDACCAVRELQKLEAKGIRFRTRALTTTLFSRLCFADLFVHGIGGAKYDQMTDRITCRFFGLKPPDFLTMSATLLLPVQGPASHPADEARLLRQLRELDYNSDRHLSVEVARQHGGVVAEKQRLVHEQNAVRAARDAAKRSHPPAEGGIDRRPPTPAAPATLPGSSAGYWRFRRLQELNRQLAELTRGERQRMEEELHATRAHLAANSVWHDREYAFCLYPTDKLQRFMDHACASKGG